ncbi:uncharacterized protein L3040_001859 [Drepanopeziza brunnea f. sp. 'multigermtubi']|uniref:Translation regulator (Cya5) n=1 Tax=Marssonina brunnea f. sp. multigermtubi (strain MB_m1) TaxID=1072389 RepID=K1Y3N5_MARBU|nr:translation regulator (Cya5) [Drepanopeziza brunnea f. sp. 'multigermtubi' MB_m1]EKD19794.1 translation regulator (Cya5) [Drepanopeziza brunnea f. sp. 'multigermtubi' MB_m1]KAJ5052100.1 hypothetical protein L3040_001859 [Drepanopeziza brunnea f. sp. 'multigermtubi']
MAQTGTLLEFLYPSGTMNILRQYSGWGADSQGGRLVRNNLDRIGYRQYSSFAKDSNTDMTETAAETEAVADNVLSAADNASMKRLYERLGLEKNYDFEEAWRQYSLLELESEQGPLRMQLIRYLSPSERIVDAERIIKLFELLDPEERTPIAYRLTIRSYLRLRNLADAMTLHETGLKTLAIPAGSEELLAYLVKNSSWSRAFSIWQQVQDFRDRPGVKVSYNIFEVLDQDPSLSSQALDLAEYANRRIGNAPPEKSEEFLSLINFASRIVRRALLNSQTFNPNKFMALLIVLQNWKLATPMLYDQAIDLLINLQETKLAVRCYRQARKENDVNWNRPTLHKLLKIFCVHHSIIGMQAVLDDFFRIYSSPTRLAYKMCMSEFAAQGDAQTVHALFDQLCEKSAEKKKLNPKTKTLLQVDDLAPVLHVHAKRGEVQEVVRFFRSIKSVYGFEPSLLCWNILISAYGKIRDTDRAYACFEKLLDDETLQPDDYTFGTMMGICTTRGDVDRVIGLYKLAEQLQVQRSAAMIDTLVLSHIRDGDIDKAETICEEAAGMELKGSRTRMWNQLLVAYAMQRDLVTVNRLLQRMSQLGVDYDGYTYSALMQALCVVRQPDRAYSILTNVMPQAGISSTPFHYAIVMGGFLATGELHKVFDLSNRMVKRKMRASASSKLFELQAQVVEDERLMEEGQASEMIGRALEMFQGAIAAIDPQDISDTTRKGAGNVPVDIAYPTMFYRYIIFVVGQYSEFSTVDKLYDAFKRILPGYRQTVPLEILYPMMEAKLVERDHDAIQRFWELALAQAKGAGTPLVNSGNLPEDHLTEVRSEKILPARQLDLVRHLTVYLKSLNIQMKSDVMTQTVNGLLEDGFLLDNHNWNSYIELLARRHAYKLAFELCETHLMDGWTGWARIRWSLPERNRLPLDLRNTRKKPRHLRPKYLTILYLARGYLELQSMAAESTADETLLNYLETNCPRVVRAITTMQRVDDYLERTVLRNF